MQFFLKKQEDSVDGGQVMCSMYPDHSVIMTGYITTHLLHSLHMICIQTEEGTTPPLKTLTAVREEQCLSVLMIHSQVVNHSVNVQWNYFYCETLKL